MPYFFLFNTEPFGRVTTIVEIVARRRSARDLIDGELALHCVYISSTTFLLDAHLRE